MRERSDQLSAREREVVTLIASGLSSREVAARLGITIRTVLVHRYNAMRKWRVHSVIGLVRAAIRFGLIEP